MKEFLPPHIEILIEERDSINQRLRALNNERFYLEDRIKQIVFELSEAAKK